MTKNEARDILMRHNSWRRCAGIDMQDVKQLGIAIDAAIIALGDSESLDLTIAYQSGYFDGKRSKSSITQNIRDAAINWPQYLGDVEYEVLDAFCDRTYFHSGGLVEKMPHWRKSIWEDINRHRTFMLLVAEASE